MRRLGKLIKSVRCIVLFQVVDDAKVPWELGKKMGKFWWLMILCFRETALFALGLFVFTYEIEYPLTLGWSLVLVIFEILRNVKKLSNWAHRFPDTFLKNMFVFLCGMVLSKFYIYGGLRRKIHDLRLLLFMLFEGLMCDV